MKKQTWETIGELIVAGLIVAFGYVLLRSF